MKTNASPQALGYLLILTISLLGATLVHLFIDLSNNRHQYEELATAVGRSIFQKMVIIRRWNAEHGGVYIPVKEKFQPDPYLEDLPRDVTTTEGMKLTKVNLEHMTRMISELLIQDQGIKIHLTSLKLTNRANKPDLWEEKALKKFEKGSKEEFGIIGSNPSALFRYMAPMKTEGSCLNCHAKQGHNIGDIRGGISVSFSYAPFQQAVRQNDRQIYLVHIFFFLTGLTIIFLLGKKLLTRIRELQEALLRIKRLEGLLSICSNCKRIRMEGADPREQNYWIPFERYIQDRTNAEFSHGLCPECLKELYNFEYHE